MNIPASSTSNTDPPRRGLSPPVRRFLSTAFLSGLLVLWHLLSLWIGKKFLLPSPVDVLESLWKNRAEIFTVHLPATLRVVAAGGILSVLFGVLFAVAMDWNGWLRRALYPILTVSQTIPVVCLAPVFVLWFGYTDTMRILVVILVNFFTVTVSLCDGFAATRSERMELLQTYGASRLQSFALLRLPTALPYFSPRCTSLFPGASSGLRSRNGSVPRPGLALTAATA